MQIVDRASLKTVQMIHGLKAPYDALPLEDGSVLYAELATGRITRASGADYKTTKVVAEGLAGPTQMALGRDGALVVTEAAAARLTEIDPASGTRRTIAANLPIGLPAGPGMPPPYVVTGVAVGADGTVYVSANKNNAVYRLRPQR